MLYIKDLIIKWVYMKLKTVSFIFERYTIEEIQNMMVLNSEGKMEFPRDMMASDCFRGQVEPLFGFVTNITLIDEQPCIEGVECFINGTSISTNDVSENDTITETEAIDTEEDDDIEANNENRRDGRSFKQYDGMIN